MNKKVFSTIAALTVGTIAASGVLMNPTAAFAGEGKEQAADTKSCAGAKSAESDKEHKGDSKCSGEKSAESDAEMSCAAGSCSGKK